MGHRSVQIIERTRELKTIKFVKGQLELLLQGKLTITPRKYREEAHLFHPQEVIIGEFEDFGAKVLLKITQRTETYDAGFLPDVVAAECGFKDKTELMLHFRTMYPDWNADSKLGIIRFEKA